MAVGTIANIVLDPIFIFVFGLETRGAAIATILGNAAGTQSIMGYNYGAKKYKRMLAVMKAGIKVVSSIELGVMCILGIFAAGLIGKFTDSQEVIAIGCQYIRVNMLILLFVGVISMSRSTFQAMGKPQYAFGITVVRQLVLYITLLLIFDHFFGFKGMIWAQPITEMVIMMASTILLTKKLKQYEALTSTTEEMGEVKSGT